MKIEIEIPTTSETDGIIIQSALQTLVKNLDKNNIQFIAEISRKPDINKKLNSKKILIKSAL